MENTAAVEVPQQMQKIMNPDAQLEGLSFQKGNIMADLAKIAAESGQSPVIPSPAEPRATEAPMPPAPVIEAATPTPEPAKTEVQPQQVPQKFLDKDGNPDVTKIEKATVAAMTETMAVSEAMKQYREAESAMRKAHSERQALAQPASPQPQAQPQAPAIPDISMLTPQAILEELQLQGWKEGDPASQARANAIVMLKMSQIAQNAAYQRARMESQGEVERVRDTVESDQRQKEIQTIRERDPWVFTPDGIKTLTDIRKANGYGTWRQAYIHYLGEKQFEASGPQVNPTPMARTAQPPVAPVEAVSRVVSHSPSIDLTDRHSIEAHISKLPADKQMEFLRRQLTSRGVSVR